MFASMNSIEFSLLVAAVSAGFLRALTGLGGGVVLTPGFDSSLRCRHPLRHRRDVAFASAAFALQNDRTYVVISLTVLAVLFYGLSGY